jgi:hypothetical protein
MRLGDRALFYHSSCKVTGVVGIVKASAGPRAAAPPALWLCFAGLALLSAWFGFGFWFWQL